LSPFTEYTDLRPEFFIAPKYGMLDYLNKLIQNKHFGQVFLNLFFKFFIFKVKTIFT
jgi:hypothetical protein